MNNPAIRVVMNGQNIPAKKTIDTGKTIFDQDGHQALKILGVDDNGNIIAKKYKLISLDDVNELKPPEINSIEGFDGEEIHLSQLTQELIGPSMFHASDYNLHTIETAINSIIKNQAVLYDNQEKIDKFFSNLSSSQLNQFVQSISESIKDEIDKEVTKQNADLKDTLNNLLNRLNNDSNGIGIHAPSYTGSISDNVSSDMEVERRIAQRTKLLEGGSD